MHANQFLRSKSLFLLAILICFSGVMVSYKTLGNFNPPTKHIVTIYKMKFDPATLNIKKGDTVVWINKDFYQHDVTEMSQKWQSPTLKKGEQYSRVIKEDIKYFCSLHKVMKGTITILKN